MGRQGQGRRRRVATRTPDGAEVKHQARRRPRASRRRTRSGSPIGAVAVGFLAGLLIPSTRVEDEKLGEASDTRSRRPRRPARRRSSTASRSRRTPPQTAKESGQEHAEQVKDSAQESARDAADRTPSPTL